MSMLKVLSTSFKVLCGSVVISMVTYWIYKYFKDEDLCLVDYKAVQDSNDESLPVVSVCFHYPFIDEYFPNKNYPLNGTSYMEYLKGNVFDEEFQDIDYENVILNFTQYIAVVHISWRNGTTVDFSPVEAQKIVQMDVTFSGFIYDDFYHCFGTIVKESYKKDIAFLINIYKRDDELDSLMVERGNVYLILHYPNQFILTPLNIQEFALHPNRTVNDIGFHTVHGVEILKRRSKRAEHCTLGFTNFDEIVLKSLLRKNECRPPYITKYKDFPICKTRDQIRDVRYELSEKNNKNYTKSCSSMSKIDVTYSSDPSWREETYFGIGILYPEQMKIISQTQAVDFHSLLGNIGGYIGLFLGI